MSDQCPPGFTEYILGSSAEKDPLRFYGRILAEAERKLRDSVTLRYVLYGTSDDQFVGEAVFREYDTSGFSGFSDPKSFDTLEGAYAWFGDAALKAELQRQLESVK